MLELGKFQKPRISVVESDIVQPKKFVRTMSKEGFSSLFKKQKTHHLGLPRVEESSSSERLSWVTSEYTEAFVLRDKHLDLSETQKVDQVELQKIARIRNILESPAELKNSEEKEVFDYLLE